MILLYLLFLWPIINGLYTFEKGHIKSASWLSELKFTEPTKVSFTTDVETKLIFCPEIQHPGQHSVLQTDSLSNTRIIVLHIPPESKIIERLLSGFPLRCHGVIEVDSLLKLEPFELSYVSPVFQHLNFNTPSFDEELHTITNSIDSNWIVTMMTILTAVFIIPTIVLLVNINRVPV